jgi:hypothetical protein
MQVTLLLSGPEIHLEKKVRKITEHYDFFSYSPLVDFSEEGQVSNPG